MPASPLMLKLNTLLPRRPKETIMLNSSDHLQRRIKPHAPSSQLFFFYTVPRTLRVICFGWNIFCLTAGAWFHSIILSPSAFPLFPFRRLWGRENPPFLAQATDTYDTILAGDPPFRFQPSNKVFWHFFTFLLPSHNSDPDTKSDVLNPIVVLYFLAYRFYFSATERPCPDIFKPFPIQR